MRLGRHLAPGTYGFNSSRKKGRNPLARSSGREVRIGWHQLVSVAYFSREDPPNQKKGREEKGQQSISSRLRNLRSPAKRF